MMFLLLCEDVTNNNNKNYLRNILNAYINGYHIICFENRLSQTRELSKIFYDEQSLLTAINDIKNSHNDFRNLQKVIGTYVRIIDYNTDFSIAMENEKTIYYIPIDYFNDVLDKTLIITENESDFDFYIALLLQAQKENAYRIPQYVKFRCDSLPSGGSQMGSLYRTRVRKEKRITLCVTDSDKKCKYDTYGGTAQKTKDEHDSFDITRISDLHILNVREKENLIPPSYLLKHNSMKNNQVLKILEPLENTELSHLLKFVKLSGNSIKSNEEIFQHLDCPDDLRTLTKKGIEMWASSCLYPQDLIYDRKYSVGQGMPLESIQWLENFYEYLPLYLSEEHENLTTKLFYWCCAKEKVRLIS